jgi:hypothetical protein
LIEIIATFVSVMNKNFHCTNKDKKGCFDTIPQWRRDNQKGCSTRSEKPTLKWNDRLIFYRCPTNLKNGKVEELMGVARQFELGVLPYEGGLYDQPSKLVEVFNQINSLRIEDEISRQKAQEKEWQKTRSRSKSMQGLKGSPRL